MLLTPAAVNRPKSTPCDKGTCNGCTIARSWRGVNYFCPTPQKTCRTPLQGKAAITRVGLPRLVRP